MRTGSPSDREKLAYEYGLVRRGPIDIKGKGVMETWWFESEKDGNGVGQ